jgi:hypothetical protein
MLHIHFPSDFFPPLTVIFSGMLMPLLAVGEKRAVIVNGAAVING